MTGNDGAPSVRQSPMIDVSAISLAELVASSDSALKQSLSLILRKVDESARSISGWASYLDVD